MGTNILASSTSTSLIASLSTLIKGELDEIVSDDEGLDFLSYMLKSLEEKGIKKSKNPLLIDNLVKNTKEVKEIKIADLDEGLKSLELKEATFVQILQFLEHLNDGKEIKFFQKIDDKLKSLFKDAATLEEFKGAKNVKDLMNLSKKYDLALEKIVITKQDVATLKETFPKLDKKAFFNGIRTSLSSQELLKNTQQFQHSKRQKTQNNKQVNDNFMTTKKDEKKPTNILSTLLQNINEKKVKKQENIKTIKEEKVYIKTEEKPKVAIKEPLNAKNVKIEEKVKIKEQESFKIKEEEKIQRKNPIETKILKEEKQQNIEIQNQTSQDNKIQNTKTQKTNFISQENIEKQPQEESKSESNEQKSEQNSNTFSKEVGKTNNLNIKSSNFRHTLNTFAQEFKEKLQEYKPPIMKVKMTLSPKTLGEMDVTIVNRGNNLQVSINSNTTAMNIFLQNQMEFKNSLVNMGFTNLQMNFSNQKQNQHNHQNKNGTHFASDEDKEEMATEETVLQIVIPEYA